MTRDPALRRLPFELPRHSSGAELQRPTETLYGRSRRASGSSTRHFARSVKSDSAGDVLRQCYDWPSATRETPGAVEGAIANV